MSPVRRAWCAGGATVTAELPDALEEIAAALFPDDGASASPPEGTAAAATPDLRVAAADGGYRLETDGRALAGGTAAGVMAVFELELAARLLHAFPGRRALHAGGAAGPKGALLLPGAGGSGKSTLTATLARAGLPVLGDDVVLLDTADGRVHPFRRLLKLLPASSAALGIPHPPGPLGALWPEASFHHPRALGSGWADPAPITAVIFPRFDPTAETAVLTPLSGADAMRRLLEQLVVPRAASAEDFDLLARTLAGTLLGELRYGSADEALPVLVEALGG